MVDMNYSESIADLEENCMGVESETFDRAVDAMAFVESLHQLFKDNGMTSSEEPDVNELENLVDALHGELGAAVIFLCEPSFSRVPDMLRVVSSKLEKDHPADVPVTIIKGYARLAKRIENTRQNQQQMARLTKVADST